MENILRISGRHHTIKALLIAITVALFNVTGNAAKDPIKSRLSLYFNFSKINTKTLSAKLRLRQERRYVAIPDAEITFSIMSNDEEFVLGKSKTDDQGMAYFYLSDDYPVPVNEDHYMVFQGHFAGNDSIRRSTSDLEVKNSKLQLSFEESDEARSISVRFTELDPEGNDIPAMDEPVTISVTRLYSLLQIADGTTDENGLFEFAFEQEIPGDSAGNLTVVAKIVDSDIYGNITTNEIVQWGVPISLEVRAPRALWSDQAPQWMIIAVIIVLGGAWINFFIAMKHVYELVRSG